MRELIVEKIKNHWHPSLDVIFEVTMDQIDMLPDDPLLALYHSIFEYRP